MFKQLGHPGASRLLSLIKGLVESLAKLGPGGRIYIYYPGQNSLLCSRGRIVGFLRLFAVQISLKNYSRTKAVTKHVEMP